MSADIRLVAETSEEALAATRATLPGQCGRPVLAVVPCAQEAAAPIAYPDRPAHVQPTTASGRLLPLESDRWFRTLTTQHRTAAWRTLSKEMEANCKRMRAALTADDQRSLERELDEFNALAWDALTHSTRKFGDLRDRVRLIAHLLGCRDPIGSAHCGRPWELTPTEKLFALLDCEIAMIGVHTDVRESSRAEAARSKAKDDRWQVDATANDNRRASS